MLWSLRENTEKETIRKSNKMIYFKNETSGLNFGDLTNTKAKSLRLGYWCKIKNKREMDNTYSKMVRTNLCSMGGIQWVRTNLCSMGGFQKILFLFGIALIRKSIVLIWSSSLAKELRECLEELLQMQWLLLQGACSILHRSSLPRWCVLERYGSSCYHELRFLQVPRFQHTGTRELLRGILVLLLQYGFRTFLDEGNVRYDLQEIVILL